MPGGEDASARLPLCCQVGRFGFAADSPCRSNPHAACGDSLQCSAARLPALLRSSPASWDTCSAARCAVRGHPSSRRIRGETEPPNLATETNTGRGIFPAQNPQSPVRTRQGSTAKTPRNRGVFSGGAAVRAASLRTRRLNGGESGIRTHGTSRYPGQGCPSVEAEQRPLLRPSQG